MIHPKTSNKLIIMKLCALTNSVYLFYEEVIKEVSINSNDIEGNQGDKHYKCYHWQHKILTITKAMQSSLNSKCIFWLCYTVLILWMTGLIGHIKNHFPQPCFAYIYILNFVLSHQLKRRLQSHPARKFLILPEPLSICWNLRDLQAILLTLSMIRINELQ